MSITFMQKTTGRFKRVALSFRAQVYGILYCLIGLGAVGATLVAWAGIRLKAGQTLAVWMGCLVKNPNEVI